MNVLTVVASESYKDFVSGLQKDISESLSARPAWRTKRTSPARCFKTETGRHRVTPAMAKQIYRYLLKNDYTDDKDGSPPRITRRRKQVRWRRCRRIEAAMPTSVPADRQRVQRRSDAEVDDGRKLKTNPLNENFDKKEFQELWGRINRKAAYSVGFDSGELVGKVWGN